jgi:DNA-binding protein H-NS
LTQIKIVEENHHAISEDAMAIKPTNIKSLSIDKLCLLRDQVDAAIGAKITEERRTMHDRLGRLDRLVGTGARAKGVGRGLRAPVPPKYSNPENPAQTWAGRGLKPRWLVAAMKSGKKLEYFAIAAQKKAPGRRKKA